MKDKPVQFRHLGWSRKAASLTNGQHCGVVTVAVKENGNSFQLGLTFCSPTDKFCRRKGRNQALSRLQDFPITVLCPMATPGLVKDVVKGVIFGSKQIPALVPEAVYETLPQLSNWLEALARDDFKPVLAPPVCFFG